MSVTFNGKVYRVADAHNHIYPEKIAQKASDAIGSFYDLSMSEVGSSQRLYELGTSAGIEKFIVCSVATKLEQVSSINKFIHDKCAMYTEFYGLGAWHQDIKDVSKMMDEIESLGLKGIKLHPDFQEFYIDDENMLEVYRELTKRGLIVLFHTGDNRMNFSSPRRLMNVIEKIPEFKCIAAHLGGYREWKLAKDELRGTNLYVDTSSSLSFITKKEATENIEHFGVDHTLYGTDFPMWNPKKELENFFSLGLSEEDNRAILFDNFEKLFN